MMPRPAVIHWISPAPIAPRFPKLSACSTVPARTYVMVSIPRCGCQGKPARLSSGTSFRKSSRSRNGSNSDVLPNPKARRKRTPAPFRVGFASISRRTGLSDIMVSPVGSFLVGVEGDKQDEVLLEDIVERKQVL